MDFIINLNECPVLANEAYSGDVYCSQFHQTKLITIPGDESRTFGNKDVTSHR